MTHRVVLAVWSVSFALSLGCALIFAQGVARDMRWGEPVLGLDLGRAADWTGRPFRVWRGGQYRLFVSAVNFDSTHLGAPFAGEIEVAVVGPGGAPLFERRYESGATGLVLPYNYGDAELTQVALQRSVLRRSLLRARVTRADQRFASAQPALKLWRVRPDPGMGGIITYVMIFPAGFFMLLSLAVAVPLARAGRRVPLIASIVGTVAFLALL